MANMMDAGITWLNRMRRTHAGTTVVYRRGNMSATIDGATKGKSAGELHTEHGLALSADVSDWIISVADLVLNGAAVEPEDGDLIVETLGGVQITWQVHSPGEPEPAWKYEDAYRLAYRIHVKQVLG